jgi:thioredoxin 1
VKNIYYPGMEFELPVAEPLSKDNSSKTDEPSKLPGAVRMPVTKIEDLKSFQEVISREDRILVKFEADWCMPCRAMASVVEEIANQHPDVKVLAVDIEGEGLDEVLIQYEVRSLPTFVSLRAGTKVASACGTISKAELSSLISKY